MKNILCITVFVVGTVCAWAGPTLQLVPSEIVVNQGDTVTLQLNILGLGDPGSREVGSFDSFIGFDPMMFAPTGVTFTLLLGDPNLGEALTAFVAGPFWSEAADVSLLSVADLDAMQPSDFTLATYSFVALQSGTVDFYYYGGPVDNGYGELIAGSKEFVPEPSAMVLLLTGLAGTRAWCRIKRVVQCRHLCALVVLFLLATPFRSYANVDSTWVFCDDGARKGEKIKYCVKAFAKDGDAWKGFIDDAAKEWSDGTSWKLEKVDDCAMAHIVVQQGDTNGTADTHPNRRKDDKCNVNVVITLRDSALGGDFWAKDKNGEKDKNNPLNAIKHEMGHALLLDHSTNQDSNVMWRSNTNAVTLSDDDKKEGNDSQKVKLPDEKDTPVTPSKKDQSWSDGYFDIDIPANTEFTPTIVGIIPLSARSTPDFESNLPSGVDKIIRAATYFTTDYVDQDPVEVPIVFTDVVFTPRILVSLHYTPDDLTNGNNFVHQMQVGEPVGRVDENSLVAMRYNGSSWDKVPALVDRGNRVLYVPVNTLNSVFALAGTTVACDVDGNGTIDLNDIQQIFMWRNTPSCRPGDPRDADKDGVITLNDARICATKCTNKNCAP